MRTPLVTSTTAIRVRMTHPAQAVSQEAPEAELPPYLESFLAHLRLLVGVPFDYLIPDARLLPDESIRFFYLDRSWTDRLVDGVFAVGKIGSREQAHHHAAHPAIRQQLDVTQRIVRKMQRNLVDDFTSERNKDEYKGDEYTGTRETITGFVLRSAAVSGWPHMDVRAFGRIVTRDEMLKDPSLVNDPAAKPLPLLRLERLSPSVLIALFQGVPQLVWLEEPHHGIQFGVHQSTHDKSHISIYRRSPEGISEDTADNEIRVPVRKHQPRVVAISALRDRLIEKRQKDSYILEQTGSAAFAIEVLQLPWRQRFENPPLTLQGGSTSSIGYRVGSVMVAGKPHSWDLAEVSQTITQPGVQVKTGSQNQAGVPAQTGLQAQAGSQLEGGQHETLR